MKDVIIYNKLGAVVVTAPITDNCERVHKLQSDNHINLVFNLNDKFVLYAGSYILYNGVKFSVIETYYPEKKATNHYYYDVKFSAVEEHFIKYVFFRHVVVGGNTWNEPEFTLNSNLNTIAEIIVDSLNRANLGATFSLPVGNLYAETELKALSFSGVSLGEAIGYVAEQFGTEWWIENGTILHFDKCEFGDYIDLSDEYDRSGDEYVSKGLELVKISSKKTNIPQRIYVYGSERNITRQTTSVGVMNVSYAKRLHLNEALYPGGYVEVPNVTSGIEQVKFFDDVYPRREGTVSNVRLSGSSDFPIYYIADAEIPTLFNPRDLLIEGCTMRVRFVSGYLNGFDFDVNWKAATNEWEIINQSEDEQQIPFGNFIPRVGDKYVLYNIKMPQEYITLAQEELAAKALEYINNVAVSVPETTCESDATYFMKHGVSICVGQRIQVSSEHYNGGYIQSRVIGYSYNLTTPYNISFTLSSSRVTGRLATIESSISEQSSQIDGVYQDTRAISRRSWRDAKEMSEMLDSLIKEMVLVGVEENQFVTSCSYAIDNVLNKFQVTKGKLIHSVFVESASNGEWTIQPFLTVLISDNGYSDDVPYYVYFKCSKSEGNGVVVLSSAKVECEAVDGFYHFLAGIVSSKFEDKRVFNQTSGLTQIAGGTITTEVIQDANRNLIIDFASVPPRIIARNEAEIYGNIRFKGAIGGENLYRYSDYTFRKISKLGFEQSERINILLISSASIGEYVFTAEEVTEKYFATKYGGEYYARIYGAKFQLVAGSVISNFVVTSSDSTKIDKLTIKIETVSDIYLRCYPNIDSVPYTDRPLLIADKAFTVELNRSMLQVGSYATSYAPFISHIADAFKGSTVINGGLTMTNLLQLRNLEELVVAGMSGLNNDNITLWSGGNYQDAIDAVSGTNKLPILLTKAGYGSNIGVFRIDEDSVVVDNGNRKVYITTKKIEEIDVVGDSKVVSLGQNVSIEKGSYRVNINSFVIKVSASAYLKPKVPGDETHLAQDAGSVSYGCTVKLKIGSLNPINLGSCNGNLIYPVNATGIYRATGFSLITVDAAILNKVLSEESLVRFEIVTFEIPVNVTTSSVSYSVSSGAVSAEFEQLDNLTLIAADGMAVTKGSNDKFVLKDDDVNNKLLLQFAGRIGSTDGSLSVDSNGYLKFN